MPVQGKRILIHAAEMLAGVTVLCAGVTLGIIAGLGQTTSTAAASAIADAAGIKEWNAGIKALAEEFGYIYVDTYYDMRGVEWLLDDGLHPTNAGYRVLANSLCLSADVNAAFDPIYPEVMESRNCCYINGGVVLTKYTGSRGKGGTSDASAETMGTMRRLMDKAGVVWQVGELGKVDLGGGGTVAKYVANLNVDTVDLGVPVLSMHAPLEVVSKLDVYMAHRAFSAMFDRA